MPWRRITGAVLATFLLLSVALPAMCGDCFKSATAESCGEKHGAPQHHSDASMNAKCAACGSEIQAPATRAKPDPPLANLLPTTSSPNHCADAAAPNALLADPRYFSDNHRNSSRVPTITESRSARMCPPARKLAAILTTSAATPGAPTLALLSILKI